MSDNNVIYLHDRFLHVLVNRIVENYLHEKSIGFAMDLIAELSKQLTGCVAETYPNDLEAFREDLLDMVEDKIYFDY